MGRKSLVETRINQILDAFEDCIIKNGIDYCSLEQIAVHANVKRSIIRHYLGNKDKVLKAMIDRFINNYQSEMKTAISFLKKDKLVQELLKDLFKTKTNNTDDIIIAALWAKQAHNPQIKKILHDFYSEIEKVFADTLAYTYPKAEKKEIKKAAYTLLCLMDSHTSMLALGLKNAKSKVLYNLAKQTLDGLKSG